MAAPKRVLIVGAGLAGPCLAHRLRAAGIEAELYERDPAPERGRGYRIHIDPQGELALRDCLPRNLYELALATSGRTRPGGGVTIFGPQLEERHRFDFGPDEPDGSPGRHISVDRLVLRQVLLHGLEDVTHYGAAFDKYEELPGGRVRAFFSDGTACEADVLVAADGSGSPVRQQALPAAEVKDTGLVAVFGKAPLTEAVRSVAPERALAGFSTVVGDDGRFMPLAGMEFSSDPVVAAAERAPGLAFHDTRDYLMWVLGAPEAILGVPARRLAGMEAGALVDLVHGQVGDWHPVIGELVSRSDTSTVASVPMRTSVRMEHWGSGAVTFVGDAIHCMIPSGIGAAVALRDAALLGDRLAAAARGELSLLDAIAEYEAAMLDYGFAAVEAAQRAGEQFAM